MYRNAVLRTLNRRLFSAILKTLFEAARNAHIDPYASKGILSVQQLQVLIDAVKDSYQTFLCASGYPNLQVVKRSLKAQKRSRHFS